MNKEISVIVTTFNDETEITTLFDDIFTQELKPYEIVVADGGSSDNTIQIIQKIKLKSEIPIKLLFGKRLNISQGLNEAIKNTSGEFIAIMMTGNRYGSSYLKMLYNCIEKNMADIAYPIVFGEKSNNFQKIYCDALMSSKEEDSFPSNHGVLIHTGVFKKVGLFFEKFIYAGEDTEFYNRARKYGLKMICEPEAEVVWKVPCDFKRFLKERKYYAIAEMQIDSIFGLLGRYIKKILVIGIVICLAMIRCDIRIYIFLLALYIAWAFWKFRKSGIAGFGLKGLWDGIICLLFYPT